MAAQLCHRRDRSLPPGWQRTAPDAGQPAVQLSPFCRRKAVFRGPLRLRHYHHRPMVTAGPGPAVLSCRSRRTVAATLTFIWSRRGTAMTISRTFRPTQPGTTAARRGAVALAAPVVPAAALASSVPAYAAGGNAGKRAVKSSSVCAVTGLLKLKAKPDAAGLL